MYSSIDFSISLQPIFLVDFPFMVQSPQNLWSNPYSGKSKSGSKKFFRGFYLQGKNGFKGRKSVGQKPYKNFNKIICSKGQKFKSFLKRILPSYGQTLITEHRKMGCEKLFTRIFHSRYKVHKIYSQTLISLTKNSNRTFQFFIRNSPSRFQRSMIIGLKYYRTFVLQND